VDQGVAPPSTAPTRTSDGAFGWPAAEQPEGGAPSRLDATVSIDIESPEGAAVSFALERERVLQRSEHSASVQRLRQALTLGAPLWLASLVLDWYAVQVAAAGPFWHFVMARVSVGLLGVAVLLRTRRPPEPSPRQLLLLDLAVFTLAALMNSWMASAFGGITSPYAAGVLVILVGRGSTTLEPRRSGAWMLGIPALAFPLFMIVAGQLDARIAAQFRDPVQLCIFIIIVCFMIMTWLHLTLGADFAWRLRRQALETRHIGRYKLERRLGRGGMAEVWGAYDLALKHRVALKTVSGHRPGSSALARLEREAQALASLSHPNTVRVFDYGVTDDGLWYYAMELLEGEDLRNLVTRTGPLPLDRLLHIARQILRALGEAHGKGIIHRDIKPENVFVAELGGERDIVKLLDFGIAKALAGDDAALTRTGLISGTPAYMPPEVILGVPADIRSDIYCFGATLYFAATAQLPFHEATAGALLFAHLNSSPPAFATIRVEALPPGLEQVVRRCMAKEPNDRYPSTHAVLDALAQLGQ
jgi:eukaryotic-like serine/threonine-protein kinase